MRTESEIREHIDKIEKSGIPNDLSKYLIHTLLWVLDGGEVVNVSPTEGAARSAQPQLDDERAVLKEIIYLLVFAYENKDIESPHNFEYEALRFAYAYTKNWENIQKRDFIESVMKKVSAFFV